MILVAIVAAYGSPPWVFRRLFCHNKNARIRAIISESHKHKESTTTVRDNSLARRGAPWVRKFGKLSIQENYDVTVRVDFPGSGR